MTTDEEHLHRLAASSPVAVLATTRSDGSVHASVVSGGVMSEPGGGRMAVAVVVAGRARKLDLLRAAGRASATFVNGFDWASAEGPVTVIGPDDPNPAVPSSEVPQLLRDVFVAAGGAHDDWDEYDRVMAEERRAAVFIRVERVLRNR